MFERFDPLASGGVEKTSSGSPQAQAFPEKEFSQVAKGASGHFQDFSPVRGLKPGSPPAAQGSGQTAAPDPAASEEKTLAGQPSLGYLFEPFNPGEPRDKSFQADQGLIEKTFEFNELKVQDENIVNTLDKAEKKARELLAEAEEKAQRLTQEMEAQVQGQRRELLVELQAEAQKEADSLLAAARSEAERLTQQAQAQAGELANNHQEMSKLQEEFNKLKEELERLKAEEAAKQAALSQRETQLTAREKELAAGQQNLEAEKIKATQAAQLAMEQAVREGHQAGLAQGLAQGEAEGRAKGEAVGREQALERVKSLTLALAKVENIWPSLWETYGSLMTQLAVEAAEAIVNKEIESGQGLAAGAFRACVAYLSKAHEATFRVNPADLAELEAARAETRGLVDGLARVKFLPDPAMGPGDLVMESDVGRLDATLKSRREKVMTVLREALAQGLVAEPPEPAPSTPEVAPEIVAPEGAPVVGLTGLGPEVGPAPGATPSAPGPLEPGPANQVA